MKTRLFLLTTVFLLAATGRAQDENLKMRFDFANVSGAQVTDNVSGITARVVSPAKVETMGDYHVLNLGSGTGYLDMTAQAGQQLAATGNHSISVYYRVDESASLSGNGYFLWSFSTSDACAQSVGRYSYYRLNTQCVAVSTGGWSSETSYAVGSESARGRWIHVAYTQTGSTGRLYIDGKLKGTVNNMPTNSTVYDSQKPTFCWLGRSSYATDIYLQNTLVADFRLYEKALTAAEIAEMAKMTEQLEEAYLYGTAGNPTALSAAIGEAETVLAEAGSYLPDAVRDLTDVVTMGRMVAKGSYSQAYMDNLTEQIVTITANVKNSAGVTMPLVTTLIGNYDTNRGFLHPGGLHSQADFDRIKRQLAEGNATVKSAYQKLKNSQYAQPSTYFGPTESVIRGGSGQNYINCARAAATAYQNGLRWKIEGSVACAKQAVRILNDWATTCKKVDGDTNYALAAGLYGYQFAQAAELVRDYEGWTESDFRKFKRWMLDVWYPSNTYFMRARNGTWENLDHWWRAPGHYWSNWGLCNALSLVSIGVLCDDVAVYNQGMSYFKYDQEGTFKDPRIATTIQNDGLDEFLGNLVVTTAESELEAGAYGRLGQMQESGRDIGHACMALGLAVDLAKVGWNQGDDLFAYMDHRLAAGIEFVAGQEQELTGMPWTRYEYYDVRTAPGSGWFMDSYVTGTQSRPYWGTVIGIYEGVKGVRMPLSEWSYNRMGIDGVTNIGVSGDCDHLGFSVLTSTYDEQLCPPEKVPTELSPLMEYDGELATLIPSLSGEQKRGMVSGSTLHHNEMGALFGSNTINNRNSVPRGHTVKLMPQLPDGEEDTGLWRWDTGEQTRDITVNTDRSRIYRVTYTNQNGIESQQCFAIAVENDCEPTTITPSITMGSQNMEGKTSATVMYGQTVTLKLAPSSSWGTYQWSTGQTDASITTAPLLSARDITGYYVNQVSGVSAQTFHFDIIYAEPYATVGTTTTKTDKVLLNAGDAVTLSINTPTVIGNGDVTWNDGTKGKKLSLDNVQTSGTYTATFQLNGETIETTFIVYVKATEAPVIETGNYAIVEAATGRLLTGHGKNVAVTFEEGDIQSPAKEQTWFIDSQNDTRYSITNLPDSLGLSTAAKLTTSRLYSFTFDGAEGYSQYGLHTGYTASSYKYWTVKDDGTLLTTNTKLTDFPFMLVPISKETGIEDVTIGNLASANSGWYDLSGRKIVNRTSVNGKMPRGVYIVNGKKVIVR